MLLQNKHYTYNLSEGTFIIILPGDLGARKFPCHLVPLG